MVVHGLPKIDCLRRVDHLQVRLGDIDMGCHDVASKLRTEEGQTIKTIEEGRRLKAQGSLTEKEFDATNQITHGTNGQTDPGRYQVLLVLCSLDKEVTSSTTGK